MRRLPDNIPTKLHDLLEKMASDLPLMLDGNLVGIYLWGSLTYGAFDETCSDVDCIVVTREDVTDAQFSLLEGWFEQSFDENPWTRKLDMRFVIDNEFLDKTSRCCGYHFGKLWRHGSDGNPIIWLNIGESAITLWGKPANEIAPYISQERLYDALLLELAYLKEDLAANAGNTSALAFFHNSYAVLTACRIFYTARHATLTSKDRASDWALENVPEEWHTIITKATENRLAGKGAKTEELENDAVNFVLFIENEVNKSDPFPR